MATEEADGAKIIETDAAGFYRQHLWTGSPQPENDAGKNTMASNTAYLLVPTEQLPIAVWNSGGSSGARLYNSIGIRFDDATGIHDVHIDGERQSSNDTATAIGWYTLDGRKLAGMPTKPGLYICDGKKVVIKLKKH